jgi:hypothetical protein
MSCRKMNSKLSDLLLDPSSAPMSVRQHAEACADCREELEELRATMNLLDDWGTPPANPFFDAKLLARLRAEQENAPAGLLERTRAWFLYSSRLRVQTLATAALGIAVVVGGGTFADIEWRLAQQTQQESATVRDLKSLDGNSQVFQQLDSVDQSADQQNQDSGSANTSPSED